LGGPPPNFFVVLFWKNPVYTRIMHSQWVLRPAGAANTVIINENPRTLDNNKFMMLKANGSRVIAVHNKTIQQRNVGKIQHFFG
jgi:hypothetical protein